MVASFGFMTCGLFHVAGTSEGLHLTMVAVVALVLLLTLFAGCPMTRRSADTQTEDTQRGTKRDKTKKGAAIGAASGAVLGAVLGEGELDEILAGAAVGAGIGHGRSWRNSGTADWGQNR